jgi:hypothetical protein
MKKDPVLVQFDFDENYATVVDLICFNLDINSGKYFRNNTDAEKYLSIISKEKNYPDIVLISSYLGKSSLDGKTLAEKIKKLSPDTIVIAYTADDEADWGDFLAIKSSDGQEHSLIAILSKLTGKEFNFDNSKLKTASSD